MKLYNYYIHSSYKLENSMFVIKERIGKYTKKITDRFVITTYIATTLRYTHFTYVSIFFNYRHIGHYKIIEK